MYFSYHDKHGIFNIKGRSIEKTNEKDLILKLEKTKRYGYKIIQFGFIMTNYYTKIFRHNCLKPDNNYVKVKIHVGM